MKARVLVVLLALVTACRTAGPERVTEHECNARVDQSTLVDAGFVHHKFVITNLSLHARVKALSVNLDRLDAYVAVASPPGWKGIVRVCAETKRVCRVQWMAQRPLTPGAVTGEFVFLFEGEHPARIESWWADLDLCSVGGIDGSVESSVPMP